jgi:hypothetical protein
LSPVEVSLWWSQIWDTEVVRVSTRISQSELMNFFTLLSWKRLSVSCRKEPFSVCFAANSISVLDFLKLFIFVNTSISI